ncbi:MAG TPA: hypothetical protein DCX79_14785 [Planctomycetaceae bacterium]|nr:hypothetical protein [Planctomycetaceae bacterium]
MIQSRVASVLLPFLTGWYITPLSIFLNHCSNVVSFPTVMPVGGGSGRTGQWPGHGNLTSQFFANVFLDPIDHFVREELRAPGYVRYCDDLVLFGESRQQMWQYQERLAERLQTLRLCLHQHKTHVAPAERGVAFLGIRIRRDGLRLLSAGVRRFTRRMARHQWQSETGQCDWRHLQASVRAWLGHAGQVNSRGLVKSLLRRIHFGRSTEKINR